MEIQVKDKFRKIINEYYHKINKSNKALNNNSVNNYEPSPRKLDLNSKNIILYSNNNNNKTSQLVISDSNSQGKIKLEIEENKNKQNIRSTNKKSSKELSSYSKLYNNFDTVYSSNTISNLSSNLINMSNIDSSNISNSHFSNYKTNFKCY